MFKKSKGRQVPYRDKVLTIESANLIAYWPLTETSGTTADNYEGTAARDGTYLRDVSTMGTVTGIGDGNTAPDFDGTNDGVAVYSASLAGAFNGDELTIQAWGKTSNWNNATERNLYQFLADANNFIKALKAGAANFWRFQRRAQGAYETVNDASHNPTSWYCYHVVVSKTGGYLRGYYNGTQEGTDQTYNSDWAGAIVTDVCSIGCANYTTPIIPWDGGIAHVAIWTKALSAANITTLATV